ncbi:hypothetical protein [Muriicola sp. Z0-33]|uniref:hypothetical protein n=1 Tax=Muriicola sp. Z0-33 TaxID=2816957 RepID=UPI0022374439|nr:hypothetical protein [Muriicola sp. Z0-33]MCW5516700.1 hypothetical protein [Muriicola sp. Z0-33]
MLIDEAEYLYSLPYIFILVTVLIITSETIKYHSKVLLLYKTICGEIEQIIGEMNGPIKAVKRQKIKFFNLKRSINQNGVTLKKFKDLQKLREELINEINAGAGS